MILVLILVFNILASSQAKPATNMNIEEASITMGENENGKGDYQLNELNELNEINELNELNNLNQLNQLNRQSGSTSGQRGGGWGRK